MAYPRDIFSALGRVGAPIGNLIEREISETRNMGQSFVDWLRKRGEQSLGYSQLPDQITPHGIANWLNDDETIKRRAAQAGLAGPFAPSLLAPWGRGERDKALMQRIMYDKGYSNIPIPEDYYFTLNPFNRWR